MPPEQYTQLVLTEMRQRVSGLAGRRLRSIYFGGGTPSLIAPDLIVSIIDEVSSQGLNIDQSTEVTIEINPATVSEANLQTYLKAGINRFSVGAQTFKDDLLKLCGREHTADQTRQTLKLLDRHQLNYSFDLLFALPSQSLQDLRNDLGELNTFQPKHLSAYCLTVPTGHPMSKGRPPDAEQVKMFALIRDELESMELMQYEISNFAKLGFESKHNMSYWDNTEFWGLGLSAHSYLKSSEWGTRFWNPKSFDAYKKQLELNAIANPHEALPEDQVERLQLHESLTDICHMHLRTLSGLPESSIIANFPENVRDRVFFELETLRSEGFLSLSDDRWALTQDGILMSNKVFERLAFLPNDLP